MANKLFISKGYGIGSAVFSLTHSGDAIGASSRFGSQSNLLKTKFTNVSTS